MWALTSVSALIHRGGAFVFSFNISTIYPHEAPKVKCLTKVTLFVSYSA